MNRRMFGALAIVASLLSSACTWKVGGAPPTNYDFSEFETYDRPHAESPTYADAGAPTAQPVARGLVSSPSARALMAASPVQ